MLGKVLHRKASLWALRMYSSIYVSGWSLNLGIPCTNQISPHLQQAWSAKLLYALNKK